VLPFDARHADAAVLVWDAADRPVRELLVRCKARGIPVRVLGVGGGGGSGSGEGGGDPPAVEGLGRRGSSD
jgi:hypothetical protein